MKGNEWKEKTNEKRIKKIKKEMTEEKKGKKWKKKTKEK